MQRPVEPALSEVEGAGANLAQGGSLGRGLTPRIHADRKGNAGTPRFLK